MKKHLVFVTVVAIVAILFVGYRLTLVSVIKHDGGQNTVPTVEDRCKFVYKTNNGNFHISEPAAGMYKYELYATPDGFVEVWKCR